MVSLYSSVDRSVVSVGECVKLNVTVTFDKRVRFSTTWPYEVHAIYPTGADEVEESGSICYNRCDSIRFNC